ncbi:sigma-54-dependent Fis family transcriptional regulator [Roseiconus nitratireducens]|uniref:DNA-binding transcriptional regulator NtrC n=1 Tax=Roseiconus nitratireducens TaxID=2605748 RepID=A0A5M6D692_9BACT|nr:sigma-54 dependent transcriptional regulator [Roseiconus nitratireducens]KAA5543044.1 sigma-54-dependent Fis family transcriptional regulator [Roseiconus nitratireducens]
MADVLVIDDDPMVQQLVAAALKKLDLGVRFADSAAAGLQAIRDLNPDTLFLDIKLPDVSGLDLTEQIRLLDPKLPVVFITVSDDSNTAIEAMTAGAYEFLLKPLDMAQVQEVACRAIKARRMMRVPVRMSESVGELEGERQSGTEDPMIGRSLPMLEVYKDVGRVANQEVPVLICGESGTGKELVARAVYQHSLRSDKPFLAVNCAALSETLLESELFGHEKGAFTGADRRRIGKFEQCDGGTIFLDEVGDMAAEVQSKVLRLLQEQTFERVGGSETIQTDVRIISATNRDLEAMIEAGEFRLDLYHRLNGYLIQLPPLRDRMEDIVRLVEYLLVRYSRESGKELRGIAPETLARLRHYDWPGNIREMQSVIRKAVLKSTGPVLVPDTLPTEIINAGGGDTEFPEAERRAKPASSNPPVASEIQPGRGSGDPAGADGTGEMCSDLAQFLSDERIAKSETLYAETLEVMERYLIARVLRSTQGNQSRAAATLGISRGSLRNKIRTLGISIESHVTTAERGSRSKE